jgi:hypothetical protein
MRCQHLTRGGVFLALFGACVLAGTASLALVAGVGGADTRVDVRSEVAASQMNALFFVDLPGANTVATAPAGQSRLFIARFAGESQCRVRPPPVRLLLAANHTNGVVGASTLLDLPPIDGVRRNPAGAG